MRVDAFDFELPESLIATTPAHPRDSARLLVVANSFEDRHIYDLPEILRKGDVLVLNDTRVIPARLWGQRGEAKVEVLLHKPCEQGWEVFARPAKRLREGDEVGFGEGFSARVIGKTPDGQVVIAFNVAASELPAMLVRFGTMPLPPYIEKKRSAGEQDASDYQTVYARHEGSVAAPTAGLHFTPSLMAALEKRGVEIRYVTLHVGAGTFLPVKADDTADHVMHAETYELSTETADAINAAKEQRRRVVAVGTTSVRVLESCADEAGVLHAGLGETRIFITPGYRFKVVDCLMTNFHLPRSTLFMLVSAFAGLERMQEAYAHAIDGNYRFYSYGDGCFLEKKAA